MKYTFIGTHEPLPFHGVAYRFTMETDAETLTALCEAFRDFLRGCGFSVNDIGELTYYEEDEDGNSECE